TLRFRTRRAVYCSASYVGLSGAHRRRRHLRPPEPRAPPGISQRSAHRYCARWLAVGGGGSGAVQSVRVRTGLRFTTCSAEDLIVLKLFAFRPQDLLDVETIAVRQRGKLDWAHIERHLGPLAEIKEQPEIMDALAVAPQ